MRRNAFKLFLKNCVNPFLSASFHFTQKMLCIISPNGRFSLQVTRRCLSVFYFREWEKKRLCLKSAVRHSIDAQMMMFFCLATWSRFAMHHCQYNCVFNVHIISKSLPCCGIGKRPFIINKDVPIFRSIWDCSCNWLHCINTITDKWHTLSLSMYKFTSCQLFTYSIYNLAATKAAATKMILFAARNVIPTNVFWKKKLVPTIKMAKTGKREKKRNLVSIDALRLIYRMIVWWWSFNVLLVKIMMVSQNRIYDAVEMHTLFDLSIVEIQFEVWASKRERKRVKERIKNSATTISGNAH